MELIKNVNTSNLYCLPQKTKVILIVIDALKYDFGLYDPGNYFAYKNIYFLLLIIKYVINYFDLYIGLTNPLPFQNKLPILYDTLKAYPKHAHITRFVADPPTTTLQRLKGITTGGLPTFIDIGSNFGTSEIDEDNIIDQIINNGLNVIFMGDSTWTDLFPSQFLRSYSYPSFNIFDLDTVDSAIKKQLPNELKHNDWDLLIAHFLGVDHCGHKYGPMHREMSRKLGEMNTVITDVINQMDNETTLFIIGDHGMTDNGKAKR